MKSVLSQVKYYMISDMLCTTKPQFDIITWECCKMEVFNTVGIPLSFRWRITRGNEIHYMVADPIIDLLNMIYPKPFPARWEE